jgi:hypothetical protein
MQRLTIRDIEHRYTGTRVAEQTWQHLQQPDTTAVVLLDYADDSTIIAVCSDRLSPAKAIMGLSDTMPSSVAVCWRGGTDRCY